VVQPKPVKERTGKKRMLDIKEIIKLHETEETKATTSEITLKLAEVISGSLSKKEMQDLMGFIKSEYTEDEMKAVFYKKINLVNLCPK